MLTSAAGAWRVAETIHNRAIGPAIKPIANVDKRARLSSVWNSAGKKVKIIIKIGAIKTTRVLGISLKCLQITRFVLNTTIARRAIKSPSSPPVFNEPETIIKIPKNVPPIALHVRLEVFSPIANLAINAEKIGAAAIIVTTLATSVLVTAWMKAVVPIAARAEEIKSGHLKFAISVSRFFPNVFQTMMDIDGIEKRPTKKAIVQPSISATLVNNESVETMNIPLAAKNNPNGLPELVNCLSLLLLIEGLYLDARSGNMLLDLKRFI
tara:strand:- start:2642 stop:3442 length:801 start_codon:yes stop_codon:yes gene_type:complete